MIKNTELIIMNVCNINIAAIFKAGLDNTIINITDIARYKNPENPGDVIIKWISSIDTIGFLETWEAGANPNFNFSRSGEIKNLIRIGHRISATTWVEQTNAIGIIPSGRGRYSKGTFANHIIATAFAESISHDFHIAFINGFYAMLKDYTRRHSLEFERTRTLTAFNYRQQTNAIQERLITPDMSPGDIRYIFAQEGDRTNYAATGMIAGDWRRLIAPNYPDAQNMRDTVNIEQLNVINNLQVLNGYLIRQGVSAEERDAILRSEAEHEYNVYRSRLKHGKKRLMTRSIDDNDN